MRQLRELATPFPPSLVHKAPQGKYGSYVEHSTYTERLLSIVGPYSTEVREILRGPDGTIEGVLLALTVTIDGRTVTVVEAGDCEQPGNWKTQGARMKDAMSDAIKRCCSRIGLGLHLWSQDSYFLDKQLDKLIGQEQLPGLDGAAPGGAGRAGSPPPPPAEGGG
jgi:hypothetical protein